MKHRIEKMELLEMNDDCLEYLLKFCDADSLVAASQTCTKLNIIATPLFKHKTRYHCQIKSNKDIMCAKRTIGSIGKYLIQLDFCAFINHRKIIGPFFGRLSKRCPNLQILKVISRISPKLIFNNVYKLKQLERLIVLKWNVEQIDELSAIELEHALQQLQLVDLNSIRLGAQNIGIFFQDVQDANRYYCYVNGSKFDCKTFSWNNLTLEIRLKIERNYQTD